MPPPSLFQALISGSSGMLTWKRRGDTWHRGFVTGVPFWAGQSGVLAPWSVIAFGVPGTPWETHLHLRPRR